MSDFLTDAQREGFRKNLEESAIKTKTEIDSLNDEIKETQEHFPDPMDQASAIERRNSILAQINQKTQTLAKTKKAIEDFDDFGYCEACGEEIEIPRLENTPTVTTCIDCQTLIEKKNKQLHG